MKQQILILIPPPPPPRSFVSKGIAGVSPYRLLTRFLSPAHSNPPSAKRSRRPAVRGLLSWLRSVAVRLPAGLWSDPLMRCLLVLCLALGATQANAQASDTSVDVTIGSNGYVLRKIDFGGLDSQILMFQTQPTHGRLFDTSLVRDVGVSSVDDDNTDAYFPIEFSTGVGTVEYRPPTAAISVANGYDSFIFELHVGANHTTATVTINLVGASTQTAASGAPTVAAAMGATAYNTGVLLTASIAGVTEPNGIDVATLTWKWQQADVIGVGANAISAYSDITVARGTISSNFTPLAAHASKYLRVCAAFMDQFSAPASSELCSTGVLVSNVPFFDNTSVADQVWVTGKAITDLILPAATGGNGAVTYSLTPALPAGLSFTAATRTISGTPTATVAKTAYTLTATDADGDTGTLTFGIETGADSGISNLRLRLRLFLEGPLR